MKWIKNLENEVLQKNEYNNHQIQIDLDNFNKNFNNLSLIWHVFFYGT